MSELNVDLYGTTVGVLIGERSEFSFVPSYEGIERFGLGSTMLSIAVPLLETDARGSGARQRNFFEELLSKGSVRSQLAANARLDDSNTLGLLTRYGRDVAGALQVWDPADPLEPRTPETRPVTHDEVATMFAEVRENPLGNKGRRRLASLTGVQDKVLLARVDDAWAEPMDGYPSTHILKPQSGEFLSLIFDEEYGSRFARALGLAGFNTRIEIFSDRRALVVERYDRDGNGDRIHQEDFNQVLGFRGDEKYETGVGDGRLRAIAGVLREHAAGSEVRKLVQMMALSTVLGNLDMHAKNISIVHSPDGEVSLAPMYDVVPQLHLGLDDDVALFINGKQDFYSIDGADLVAEAEAWKVRNARTLVSDTLEQARAVAAIEKPLAGADPSLTDTVEHLARKLLDSLPPPATAPGGWGGPV